MNPVAFSTLACPDWSIDTVITKASEFGYEGIEWRGGPQGHVQPTTSAAQKGLLRKMSLDAGLSAVALTAYTSFTSHLAEERKSNLDELRRYTDLAAEIDAPYVRAFLGELAEDSIPDASMYEQLSECLRIAAEYAALVGVKVAIEPHDDFVLSARIEPILRQAQHPALRVIWDLGNTFAAGEDPKEGFELLKDWIAYVQIKDGKGRKPNWRLCPLGKGDVPLRQAFELLFANGYQGALSVEWEYAWHPELDPPEIALPAARKTVRDLVVAAQTESA
jgi:sugar phosphate isomerase/epimerase